MPEVQMNALAKAYSERGVVKIEHAATTRDVTLLKKELYRLISVAYDSNQEIAAFDKATGSHDRNPLFLDSGAAATVFHEPVALEWSDHGIREEYTEAVARVGHGLHVLPGAVHDWLLSSCVGDLCRATGRKAPAVIESMYVRKSRWSEALPPHVDHSYLWTDPPSVQVFWLALDRTDGLNGGLMVDTRGLLPGSPMRLVRTGDEATMIAVPEFSTSTMNVTELADLQLFACEPGDAVLVDGLVIHGSGESRGERARDALAIHVVDMSCVWSDRNYLGQMTPLEL